jgi:prophage regulatory protein
MQEGETPRTSLKLLRMRDLTAEYGLTPASVYRWIGDGAFPLPVNLGSNSVVAWHREEVEQWVRSRPRAKVKVRSSSNREDNGPDALSKMRGTRVEAATKPANSSREWPA